jgi:hypothetical protein
MTGAPTQAELNAARLVLDRMGVTAEDLLNSVKPPAPTFGEYIPVVAAAVSDELIDERSNPAAKVPKP